MQVAVFYITTDGSSAVQVYDIQFLNSIKRTLFVDIIHNV